MVHYAPNKEIINLRHGMKKNILRGQRRKILSDRE
jgi:hypothetical protein